MVGRPQAEEVVLRFCNASPAESPGDELVIQSCELSEAGDYWIVRANSHAFVHDGDVSRCYVGVNAHLVDTHTGDHELVGSAQSVEQYLQDKYDLRTAAGRPYVLRPNFEPSDRHQAIRLRQLLGISAMAVLRLVAEPQRPWYHGSRRVLEGLQSALADHHISTRIVVEGGIGQATIVHDGLSVEAALKLLALAAAPSDA
jgi:hypothetical protein